MRKTKFDITDIELKYRISLKGIVEEEKFCLRLKKDEYRELDRLIRDNCIIESMNELHGVDPLDIVSEIRIKIRNILIDYATNRHFGLELPQDILTEISKIYRLLGDKSRYSTDKFRDYSVNQFLYMGEILDLDGGIKKQDAIEQLYVTAITNLGTLSEVKEILNDSKRYSLSPRQMENALFNRIRFNQNELHEAEAIFEAVYHRNSAFLNEFKKKNIVIPSTFTAALSAADNAINIKDHQLAEEMYNIAKKKLNHIDQALALADSMIRSKNFTSTNEIEKSLHTALNICCNSEDYVNLAELYLKINQIETACKYYLVAAEKSKSFEHITKIFESTKKNVPYKFKDEILIRCYKKSQDDSSILKNEKQVIELANIIETYSNKNADKFALDLLKSYELSDEIEKYEKRKKERGAHSIVTIDMSEDILFKSPDHIEQSNVNCDRYNTTGIGSY